VKQFKVFHLNYLHERRLKSKNRFYQCIERVHDSNTSFVSSYRSNNLKKSEKIHIPTEWFETYELQGINIYKEINFKEAYFWFDLAVIELFKKYGFAKFKYLAIWDKKWIEQMKGFLKIADPRSIPLKLIHFYLKISQRFYPSFIVKAIDKPLKLFINK
jgi:hypothetical protein